MRLRIGARTDVGRVRDLNEDVYAVRPDQGLFDVRGADALRDRRRIVRRLADLGPREKCFVVSHRRLVGAPRGIAGIERHRTLH